MARKITRYFETLDEAIKEARKRAKSNYCTQGIYQNDEKKLFIHNALTTKFTAIAKVKFDGTVEHLDRAQKLQKAATFEDIAGEVGMRYEPGWDYGAGQEVPHMHVFHTGVMDSRSCWINHVFHFADSVQECLERKLHAEALY